MNKFNKAYEIPCQNLSKAGDIAVSESLLNMIPVPFFRGYYRKGEGRDTQNCPEPGCVGEISVMVQGKKVKLDHLDEGKIIAFQAGYKDHKIVRIRCERCVADCDLE